MCCCGMMITGYNKGGNKVSCLEHRLFFYYYVDMIRMKKNRKKTNELRC